MGKAVSRFTASPPHRLTAFKKEVKRDEKGLHVYV